MDILLEFSDTFIADYAYAYLFPNGYQNKADVNTSTQVIGTWVWRPASKFLNIQPSQAAYISSMSRDNLYRQLFTIFFIIWILGIIVYFISATLVYHLIYDKRYMKHPKFIKNQIWIEIKLTNWAVPIVAILIEPFFLLQVRGYANLYDTSAEGPGWWYDILQIPLFLLYSEFCAYWVHRLIHHPRVYTHSLFMHKLHHRFVITTPYSSIAVHPTEGFTSALPILIFPFIFPVQKIVYFLLYTCTSLWLISVHDGVFFINNRITNGAACHSLHHMHRNCNYGLYSTLFDRIYGTYRAPDNWMYQEERWMSQMQTKKYSQTLKKLSKRKQQ